MWGTHFRLRSIYPYEIPLTVLTGHFLLEFQALLGHRETSRDVVRSGGICPEPDSNRHELPPRDFKSLASTDFATRAPKRCAILSQFQ